MDPCPISFIGPTVDIIKLKEKKGLELGDNRRLSKIVLTDSHN